LRIKLPESAGLKFSNGRGFQKTAPLLLYWLARGVVVEWILNQWSPTLLGHKSAMQEGQAQRLK
jgi:hypothetical protein